MRPVFACAESRRSRIGCARRCWRARRRSMADPDLVRCDACPVTCYIKPGRAGACDRYANEDGKLVRVDPLVVLEHTIEAGAKVVPFLGQGSTEWNGEIVKSPSTFITAIVAGTT